MANSTNESLIPKGYVPVKGSELKISSTTKYLGAADDSESFNIIIALRRRADGPAFPGFDFFAKTPPRLRPRYTQEEFAANYGAHPDDVNKVLAFIESAGLKVQETNLASRNIKVAGTVAEMNKAFGVSLGKYEEQVAASNRKDETVKKIYRGREGHYYVPAELGNIIVTVAGLDNRSVSKRANTGDPTSTNPVSIQTLRKLYNFPTNSAAGEVIGIASLGGISGYYPSDMNQFFGSAMPVIIPISGDPAFTSGVFEIFTSQPSPQGTNVLYFKPSDLQQLDGGAVGFAVYPSPGSGIPDNYEGIKAVDIAAGTITIGNGFPAYTNPFTFTQAVQANTPIYINPDIETSQDIQIAGAAAPGADINVYFDADSQFGWVEMMARVAHPQPGDKACSVFSSSWVLSQNDDPTISNANITAANMDAISAQLQDAAMFGITMCFASGDKGSAAGYSDGIAHVSYPTSDPWVLGVGGTTVGNISGSSFTEYVWNDDGTLDSYPVQGYEFHGATGGGVSAYFPLPSYQNNANVPKSVNNGVVGRGVPDVAANASPNSGYSGLVLCGQPNVGNGTSASAPLWAGLIAVINAALGEHVGFINPYIYQIGKSAFNLINITDALAPTNNQLVTFTSPGYPATTEWDACTGWGSPNGVALLNAFKALSTPSVYVNGGYQSADVILLDLSMTPPTPIPLGGLPDTPWDTILQANTAYGFQAVLHNPTNMPATVADVNFWSIPGGVGTMNGTLLDTVSNVVVPAYGSTVVTSTKSFTTDGGLHGHLCAVVSLHSPATGCPTVTETFSSLIPDPGQPGTRGCSAWRNTSYIGIKASNNFGFTIGTGLLPVHFKEPILITVEPTYIPATWRQLAPVKELMDTLDFLGAESKVPLYLLPSLRRLFTPAKIKTKISNSRGGSIEEREPGTWTLVPHEKREEISFEISGQLPDKTEADDIFLVNVKAHYPQTDGMEAKTVEFLEFVYAKQKPGRR